MCAPLVLNVLITVQISSVSVLKINTPGSPVTDSGVTSKLGRVYVCLVEKGGLNGSCVVV